MLTLLSMIVILAVGIALGLGLSSTGLFAPKIDVYAGNTATSADIHQFFDGELRAFGCLSDITGRVFSRFSAKVTGDWQGDIGSLREDFTFDDGRRESRLWQFVLNPENGSFIATAPDVLGQGKGAQRGNSIFMRYILARQIGDKHFNFSIDDRFYRINNHQMIKQTKLRKFGITIAEGSMAFYK
jgi:hypothetical protein